MHHPGQEGAGRERGVRRRLPELVTVLEWLLDSDPSIRWQALRDLSGAPSEVVVSERARVVVDGGVPGCWLCAGRTANGRGRVLPGAKGPIR